MEFSHFLSAMTPFNIALALFGVVAGTVIGSIPGLTATMALAVLVPITFSMDPASALILLGAIYTGAIYGGAYAAILLNTPAHHQLLQLLLMVTLWLNEVMVI